MEITKKELTKLIENVIDKKLNEEKEWPVTISGTNIYIVMNSMGLRLCGEDYVGRGQAMRITDYVMKKFKEKYNISLGEPDIDEASADMAFASFDDVDDVMSELVYNSVYNTLEKNNIK